MKSVMCKPAQWILVARPKFIKTCKANKKCNILNWSFIVNWIYTVTYELNLEDQSFLQNSHHWKLKTKMINYVSSLPLFVANTPVYTLKLIDYKTNKKTHFNLLKLFENKIEFLHYEEEALCFCLFLVGM